MRQLPPAEPEEEEELRILRHLLARRFAGRNPSGLQGFEQL